VKIFGEVRHGLWAVRLQIRILTVVSSPPKCASARC